jgi:hypothetical protein
MQSTDLISLLVIALGNAQVSGTRSAEIAAVAELLNLDISCTNEKYAPVRFLTKEAQDGKTLGDWLLAQDGLKQLRLIKGQLQSPPGMPEGTTPAVLAGMQGASPMLLLAVFSDHCDIFAPRMITPPQVDLKVDDLLDVVMNSAKASLIREQLAERHSNLPRTQNETAWQALLRHLPEQLPEPVVKSLSEVLANPEVPEEERKSFEELLKSRSVVAPPRFEFAVAGRADGVPPKIEVSEASKRLQEQLGKAASFAQAKKLDQWSTHFRACAQIVATGPQQADAMLGVFDECGWPKPAVNLLAGVVRSWVFGGKGSWNDVSLSGDEEYNTISTALLEEVQSGIVAASCAVPRA